jgi:hypothetical protein
MKKPAARGVAGRGRDGIRGFREGDVACVHRKKFPGGGLSCVARFRLGRTHSLLWPPLLGRNLITVFSTVNTPTGFFCARMAVFAGDRTRPEARNASADACATDTAVGSVRKKILVLRALRCDAASSRVCARSGCEQAAADVDGVRRPCAACVSSSGKVSGLGVAQPEMRKTAQEIPPCDNASRAMGGCVCCLSTPDCGCRCVDVRGRRSRSARRSRLVRAAR